MAELHELIEYMAKALVDNPDMVQVKEIPGEKTVIYELKVVAALNLSASCPSAVAGPKARQETSASQKTSVFGKP